ncbi:hypothetical protein AJ80_07405 [Polytolypa hystricis UAMH7299]|uniref:Uncharacterized protein n=1 Tax=Polytolypa hystricis (strain UAMH7299) TaxID=1447883 RepID=A0A2B7XP90_POLH7|nr:hypothetical protein AJ80_07405 [Polytolypa hystricis UAMH7299]
MNTTTPGLRSTSQTLVTSGMFSKQADASWALASMPLIPDVFFPSFVVETGLSESVARLRRDAKAWLETAGSRAGLAVTIDVNRSHPRIVIRKWEKEQFQRRRVTRAAPLGVIMKANMTGETIISRLPNGGHKHVSNALTLPFDGIFLRAPNLAANLQERDFIFSHQELQRLADDAWDSQGF